MWVSEHCKYKVFAAAFHLCHRQILLKLSPSETVVGVCYGCVFTGDEKGVRWRADTRGSQREKLKSLSELSYLCLWGTID